MKRTFLLLALLMLMLCNFTAFAAEDYLVWDFSKEEDAAKWKPSNDTTVNVVSDGAIISSETDNMNLTFTPEQNEKIVLNDYGYVAFVYSGATVDGRLQIYHWTDKSSGNPYLQSQTDAETEKKTETFNLAKAKPTTANWDGTVKTLRLDPNRAGVKREIKIHWLGFFKDEKAYCEYAGVPYQERVKGPEKVVWDFSKQEDSEQWKPSNTTTVQVTSEGTVISGTDDGMNLTYTAQRENPIYLEDYEIAVITYKDATTDGRMQLYHWTDTSSGNPRLEKTTVKGKEVTEKFDLKNSKPSTAHWDGKVVRFRFDPMRGDGQRSMTLVSIALYRNALAYNKALMTGDDYGEAENGQPIKLYNAGVTNMSLGFGGANSEITYENNYAVITSRNGPEDGGVGDPNFYVGADFDGDKYPWMKIRLRNLSDATHFEMHFASDGNNNSLNAASCTRFPISSGDADFVEYVVNVQNANKETSGNSIWTGNIFQIRFDCMWKAEPSGQMATGSQMYIDYIGFFATEEEAKAYTTAPETEIENSKANSGKAGPTWVFDNDEILEKWTFTGADISLEGGILCIRPNSSDPTMRYELNGDERFDTKEFPYFAYRHSTKSKVTVGGMFYTTTNLTALTDASFSRIPVPNDGKWVNTITDLSDFGNYPKGNWNGTATLIRLDPVNAEDKDAVIYIDRMGFFRTAHEDYAFLSEGKKDEKIDYSKRSFIKNEEQKVIIPGGTLSEGYDKNQYLLSSAKPEGEGENPVVMYTDSNGNTSVVALGYTTSGGYTTFVANKAGKYTLGYNHKEYTDISGHWGEKYINFVSDRTLFGGTSPTEFSPEETMTRGMFVTVLGRMHGVDLAKYDGNTGYADVPATEYYAPYIQWAKSLGIMPGISDTEFAPEQPILRETMASVIANYITAFEYKFRCYDDAIEFTDLSGCDTATAQAIKNAQAAGIINGKGEGRFDPKGISTRAEVATVMQRVIKAVLGVNTATTPYTSDYFTRQRIRIGAWGFRLTFGTEEGMTILRDLGVDLVVSGSASQVEYYRNNLLNYADKYGIEIYTNQYYPSKDFQNGPDPVEVTASYSDHPSFAGSYFIDEPGTDSFGYLGDAADYYMEKMPGKIPFVNLLPMYANAAQLKMGAGAAAIEYYDPDPELYRKYCQAWFENFNVDYICTDIYPLNGKSGVENRSTWTTYKDYCESINQIATVARENDAEFWCCIQTWGWTAGKRNPTVPEYRWQCYTMLSYGCTGILL